MTRTSAIFGIVSVITAAIVGGVFIRKKIIYDALYWKAWAEFEENKRRNIRSVEEDIKEIDKNINKKIYEKEKLEKQIKKYSEEIKELEEEIKKYEQKIEELESPVDAQKIKRIDGNLKRRDKLLNQTKEIKIKVEKLEQNNNFQSQLKDKLTLAMQILEKKETIIDNYAGYKIRNHAQLKAQREKMNEILQSKDEISTGLKNSESLFSSIKLLIQEFKSTLNDKNNELAALRQQTFQGN